MRNSELYHVTFEDVQKSYDQPASAFSSAFLQRFASLNLSYKKPTQAERDAIILQVLQMIECDKQKIGAPERTEVWFKGWQENLDAFIASGGKFGNAHPKIHSAGSAHPPFW